MNDLIAVPCFNLFKQALPDQDQETVSARDLHEFLGTGKDFSTWIKGRIDAYGFLEGEDYATISRPTEAQGRDAIEYYLSFDMAKELAMIENNDVGRSVRKYFINIEKQHKQNILNQLQAKDQLLLSQEKVVTQAKSEATLLKRTTDNIRAQLVVQEAGRVYERMPDDYVNLSTALMCYQYGVPIKIWHSLVELGQVRRCTVCRRTKSGSISKAITAYHTGDLQMVFQYGLHQRALRLPYGQVQYLGLTFRYLQEVNGDPDADDGIEQPYYAKDAWNDDQRQEMANEYDQDHQDE